MSSNVKNTMMNGLRHFVKKYLPAPIVESITTKRYVREVRGHNIPEFNVIRGLLKQGGTAVDIGANFGWYTRFMAIVVKGEGKIYSIEPVPMNFKVLKGILHDLQLNNVEFFDCAISDQNGKKTMAVPLTGSGEENLYEAKIVGDIQQPNLHTIAVETRTLDSLFAGSERQIDFIKCDVEGHELQCLRGAGAVIAKFHPAWLIEVWGDPDDPASQGYETFRVMEREGYEPYVFDGQKLNKRHRGVQSVDYFFLQSGHIDQLRNTGSIIIE